MSLYLYSLGYFSGKIDTEYAYAYITHEFWGINDHPIYLSIIFAISLLLLLDNKLKNKTVSLSFFIIILLGFFFLARKGVILSFFIIAVVYIIKNRNKKELLLLFFTISILFTFSAFIPAIQKRYLELINLNKHLNDDQSSSSMRYILWKNALELSEESPVFGFSIGDVQDVFCEKLKNEGYSYLAKHNTNTHNQYIQILLSSGLLGLLLFFLSVLFFIKMLLYRRDYLGLSILTLFLFCFLFESVLYRQNGIILFSLFISSFIITLPNVEKEKNYCFRPFSSSNFRS
jgi:O-antigen ligase